MGVLSSWNRLFNRRFSFTILIFFVRLHNHNRARSRWLFLFVREFTNAACCWTCFANLPRDFVWFAQKDFFWTFIEFCFNCRHKYRIGLLLHDWSLLCLTAIYMLFFIQWAIFDVCIALGNLEWLSYMLGCRMEFLVNICIVQGVHIQLDVPSPFASLGVSRSQLVLVCHGIFVLSGLRSSNKVLRSKVLEIRPKSLVVLRYSRHVKIWFNNIKQALINLRKMTKQNKSETEIKQEDG